MRSEFQVHRLNDSGFTKAEELGVIFSDALEEIEKIVPAGSERALVITKLQEACFFAKRAMALDLANQT